MADIFLSYAKEDRDAARRLSRLLIQAGWTVWWDRRIPAGRTWRQMLETALRDMRCMVVLWSSHSIDSDWVKEEAEEARLRKKLVPALIEAVVPPVGFRTIQAADLTDWDGAGESRGVHQLIADLELILGKPAGQAGISPRPKRARAPSADQTRTEVSITGIEPMERRAEPRTRPEFGALKNPALWKLAAGVGGALVLAFGLFALWRDWAPVPGEMATAVDTAAARRGAENPPAPTLVKLGVYGNRRELTPAETVDLSVRGQFSDGTENEITGAVDWSSSNDQVAKVDGVGRVTALQSGTTHITATHGGVTSSAWTLAVKSMAPKAAAVPALVALTVNAHKSQLEPQEKIALNVTARYSDGSEKTLSRGWVLASNNAAVVSIVNDTGEVKAWREGAADVIARFGNVTSAPLRLTVKDPQWNVDVQPRRRRGAGYAPRKSLPEALVTPTPEARPTVPGPSAEQLRAKIASYLSRAKNFRAKGDYRAAMAELASAGSVDPASAEIRAEVEQTKRACLAEKKLGGKNLDCSL